VSESICTVMRACGGASSEVSTTSAGIHRQLSSLAPVELVQRLQQLPPSDAVMSARFRIRTVRPYTGAKCAVVDCLAYDYLCCAASKTSVID